MAKVSTLLKNTGISSYAHVTVTGRNVDSAWSYIRLYSKESLNVTLTLSLKYDSTTKSYFISDNEILELGILTLSESIELLHIRKELFDRWLRTGAVTETNGRPINVAAITHLPYGMDIKLTRYGAILLSEDITIKVSPVASAEISSTEYLEVPNNESFSIALEDIGPGEDVYLELSNDGDVEPGITIADGHYQCIPKVADKLPEPTSELYNPEFIYTTNWGGTDIVPDWTTSDAKVYRPKHILNNIDDYYEISGVRYAYSNVINSGEYTIQRLSSIPDEDGYRDYRLVICDDDIDSDTTVGVVYNKRTNDNSVMLRSFGTGKYLGIADNATNEVSIKLDQLCGEYRIDSNGGWPNIKITGRLYTGNQTTAGGMDIEISVNNEEIATTTTSTAGYFEYILSPDSGATIHRGADITITATSAKINKVRDTTWIRFI